MKMTCPFLHRIYVSIYDINGCRVQDCFHRLFTGIESIGNGGSEVTVIYFRQAGQLFVPNGAYCFGLKNTNFGGRVHFDCKD